MNYAEKVWDTINRAWNGDLKAQLSLLCVDVALNGDSRLIKEENKMLNFDKYREDIREDIRNYPLMNIECYLAELRGELRGVEKCKRAKCEECLKNSLRWLFSEYEPPLLENGDGLKPGSWIMVSDDDDSIIWYKNRFVCYYNATFFVVDDNGSDSFNENGTNITGWKYARLPEDGE